MTDIRASQEAQYSVSFATPDLRGSQLVAYSPVTIFAADIRASQIAVYALYEGPRVNVISPSVMMALDCFVPCSPHAIVRQ